MGFVHTYADAAHQLCCARAARIAGRRRTTPGDAQWCWADQVADALVDIQNLAAEVTVIAAPDLGQDALGKQVHLYRSAVQIAITQTAAWTGEVMRKHNALARRPRDRQDDYL